MIRSKLDLSIDTFLVTLLHVVVPKTDQCLLGSGKGATKP